MMHIRALYSELISFNSEFGNKAFRGWFMHKDDRRSDRHGLFLLLMISIMFHLVLPYAVHVAESAPYTGACRPMEFYFHYSGLPVSVAGIQTHYIMNTTKWFNFTTQKDAFDNSFYKPIGQPKIVVDFYLYPNLAGPVTITGRWQVFIWVNSSAYRPTGFTIHFKEIDLGGTVLWDSSAINPIVTSSVGSYIDVPVHNYNLTSTPLTHEFSPGTTLLVEVEVNAGSSADTRIWYDSPFYPSKVILPAQDYARPSSVKTYDANGTETNVYSVFWNESQRQVTLQANVTDPFSGYDIYMVNITVQDPSGQAVVDDVNMTRITDGLWMIRYSILYETVWSYPETASSGNYTVTVSVIDNNSYYQYLEFGTFGLYMTATTLFSIGEQHLVQIKTVDWHNQTMINASVHAISSGVTLASGYTNASGWFAAPLWSGYYNITVYWQNTEVAKELVGVTASSNFTIRCRVHYPSFRIVDDANVILPEAQVFIEWPNGTTNILPFYTTTDGLVNLTKTPAGDYTINVLWKNVYVQTTTITVTSDGPYMVKTQVYHLTAEVSGNNGAPVQGVYVVVSTQAGVVYDFKMTDASGDAVFKLPVGVYRLDAYYSTTYWFTNVATNATMSPVSVTSSGSVSLTLADFPPPITSTVGFWVLVIPIIAVVAVVGYIIYVRLKVSKRIK